MIDGVKIIKLEKFQDSRGWLAEIYRQDEAEFKPAMSYISLTLPGVARGPHEHLHQSDFFAFLFGKFKLYLWENREGFANYRQLEILEVGEDSPCSVIVPPGVVHAYKCVSETNGLVINLPDKLYRGEGKKEEVDEVRWEKEKDSPFVIE